MAGYVLILCIQSCPCSLQLSTELGDGKAGAGSSAEDEEDDGLASPFEMMGPPLKVCGERRASSFSSCHQAHLFLLP